MHAHGYVASHLDQGVQLGLVLTRRLDKLSLSFLNRAVRFFQGLHCGCQVLHLNGSISGRLLHLLLEDFEAVMGLIELGQIFFRRE
mmetsp:Transcript_26355/g.40224  ORF Transcript_26355/g.40224 Transcript_26355/m.40224 type:complete len:86 (-) Transcript_26355:142-399(-)